MTMCSMYVGELEGFTWDRLPRAVTSAFPPIWGHHYHSKFDDFVRKTGLTSVQVDFDGYVARIRKDQILALVEDCYGSDPSYTDPAKMLRWEGEAYLVTKLDRLREQVAALSPDKEYGLVSECW